MLMEMWLSEYRHKELVYFVKQYHDWVKLLNLFEYGLKSRKIPGRKIGKNSVDEYICNRAVIANNVEIIENTAKDCGLSVEDILEADAEDSMYDEFYWRLSQVRK